MTSQIITALGGLGLFLLGMTIMTEGLRKLAGDALHAWLTRFTSSPSSGALTGTVATAVLQSSSATTVTTVGFVAAGLLSFPQALGIIFGANLGTTITGWMVALLGFKLKIGSAALIFIFAGALLILLARGKWRHLGRVLAGFGVIFLGIDFMQSGMAGFQGSITPETFPPDHWGGRLLLVGIGAMIVLVTQSSSAGVAVAMTALSLGAVSFPQAACMVIGMDVGTTVTAILASVGSSDAARRTGFSHTIYNIFTAVAALLILDSYMLGLGYFSPAAVESNPELALVGFHTLFNLVALIIGLPLAGRFAAFMEKIVPRDETGLAMRLDDRLLEEPSAAAAAMEATLCDEFGYMLEWLRHSLDDTREPPRLAHAEVYQDLRDTRDYLDRMNAVPDVGNGEREVVTAIHALDHLRRMYWRLRQHDRIITVRTSQKMNQEREELLMIAGTLLGELQDGIRQETCERAEALVRVLRENSSVDRDAVISQAAEQDLSVASTGQWLAGRTWLERMAHHCWRISAHIGGVTVGEGAED